MGLALCVACFAGGTGTGPETGIRVSIGAKVPAAEPLIRVRVYAVRGGGRFIFAVRLTGFGKLVVTDRLILTFASLTKH